MIEVLLLGLAGGLGAALRMFVDGLLRDRLHRIHRGGAFPWATLLINISGSLLLGCLTGWADSGWNSLPLTMIGGIGFCGGYTTFSTAMFESIQLLRSGRAALAVGSAAAHLLLSVAAAAAGLALTSPVLP